MVGVVEYLMRFIKCGVKVIALLAKLAYKLGDSDNRVGIVELYCDILFKLVKVSKARFMLCKGRPFIRCMRIVPKERY